MTMIGLIGARLARLSAHLLGMALIAAVLVGTVATATNRTDVTTTASTPVQTVAYWSPFHEDSPRWRCARHGNRVCGPRNPEGAPAGCYRHNKLVIPWTRFDVPHLDPLWARFTPPC